MPQQKSGLGRLLGKFARTALSGIAVYVVVNVLSGKTGQKRLRQDVAILTVSCHFCFLECRILLRDFDRRDSRPMIAADFPSPSSMYVARGRGQRVQDCSGRDLLFPGAQYNKQLLRMIDCKQGACAVPHLTLSPLR